MCSKDLEIEILRHGSGLIYNNSFAFKFSRFESR